MFDRNMRFSQKKVSDVKGINTDMSIDPTTNLREHVVFQ
jgi:hypothetical protein